MFCYIDKALGSFYNNYRSYSAAHLILHIIVMGSLHCPSPWTRVAATHLFYRDNDGAVLVGSERSRFRGFLFFNT